MDTDVVHMRWSITQLLRKEEILPFGTIGMAAEGIALSEISQRRTDHRISLLCGN